MYGGNSGCSGMVIYNTKVEGDNAVYGYYKGNKMCFETGTAQAMRDMRKAREKAFTTEGNSTLKIMGIVLLAYIIAAISLFAGLSLRAGFSFLVFAVVSYAPLLIILTANTKLYTDHEQTESFRRFHGCEHAVIESLTKNKDCTIEALRKGRIYDPECGTAYSGYLIAIAVVLGLLIMFWPGLLKAVGILAVTLIALLIMILVPAINPFTVFQRPVVTQPTEREYALAVEIMIRVKEL